MKAVLVDDLLTNLSLVDVLRGIRSAYNTLEGTDPSNQCLAILTAQSALESGRWRSCHRFNLGNVKAGQSYEGYYCQFRCNEIIKGKVEWFDPPHSQTNFRAFMNLETGCLDQVAILKRRFSVAYAAAKSGDAPLFVHALKISGYFTANEAPYLKAVISLTNEYARTLVEPQRDTEPVPLPDEEVCAALACVKPDESRYLHTEAVLAMMLGQGGMWDAVREERNRNLAED